MNNMLSKVIKTSTQIFVIISLAIIVVGVTPIAMAYSTTITVNTTDDELNTDGDCSLREAIEAANTDSVVDACPAGNGDDSIEVPADTYTLTIEGADEDANQTGDLDITAGTLSVIGAGAENTVIQATDSGGAGHGIDRVFHVASGATLTLRALTVAKGNGGFYGGGILSQGTFTLDESIITGGSSGSGVFLAGSATITNSIITDNTGNGIDMHGELAIFGTTISQNGGSGIAIGEGTKFTIDTSTISGNRGGGIISIGTNTIGAIINSTISSNRAGEGGGIYNAHEAILTITDSIITDNSALIGSGGGILNIDRSALTIINSTLSGNTAINNGGAIGSDYYSTVTITNSTVSGNNAAYGGGITNTVGGSLNVLNSSISDNHAVYDGGGIYMGGDSGELIITSSTISSNTAGGSGGGIYSSYIAYTTVTSSTVSSNTAGGSGGGIFSQVYTTVTGSTVSANVADLGGGIFSQYGALSVIQSTLSGNGAFSGEGGAIAQLDGFPYLTVQNTIFADSVLSTNCYGYINDDGSNLQFGGTVVDSCGASISLADPKLGPLADNGGTTLTHALLPGSAAIDAGDIASCSRSNSITDQRGINRSLDGNGDMISECDIGAFEFENTPTGQNVTIKLEEAGTGTSPVELTFTEINQSGTSSLVTSVTGPTIPGGFSLGISPTYFDINTTAIFSSLVSVCISYVPEEYTDTNNLYLLHYENDAWTNVTTSNDTVNYVVCGQVSNLSPFVVAEQVTIPYNFTGFFQPVDNLPTLNVVKAGSAIPLKFSLGDDFGLDIFVAGYPTSTLVACGTTAEDAIEQTVTANASGLSYNAITSQYTYIWKTVKLWAGTCRTLIVKLNDGTFQRANFKFK